MAVVISYMKPEQVSDSIDHAWEEGKNWEHLHTLLLEDTNYAPYKYKVTTLSLNCSSWVGVNVAFMAF